MPEKSRQEAGTDWLEEHMKKLFKYTKPTGLWWRGKVYNVGDNLPRSLKKCLNKIIASSGCITEPGK